MAHKPSTMVGARLLVVSPKPSCPQLLPPHANTCSQGPISMCATAVPEISVAKGWTGLMGSHNVCGLCMTGGCEAAYYDALLVVEPQR